jgi:hypothetical protein
VTVLPDTDHGTAEPAVLTLSGLGQGLAAYDLHDQSIYDWLLQHNRSAAAANPALGASKMALPFLASPDAASPALTAAPKEIFSGQHTSLTWSFPGVSDCVASGDWLGARAPSGWQWVAPAPPGQYNYILTCSGPAGDVAQTATVTVYDSDSVPGYHVPIAVLDSYVGRYRLDAPERSGQGGGARRCPRLLITVPGLPSFSARRVD